MSIPFHSVEKASGKAVFVGDVRLNHTLVGKFCRSPLPHARILRIDTSRAEKLAGVKAVVTHRDFPDRRIGRWVCDRPVLAAGKVRHVGEAVAAVAAVDQDLAEEAVRLIKVEYEELPAVCDVFEAMKDGAPLVHEDLASYDWTPPAPNGSGNLLHQVRILAGDAEKALAGAEVMHHESYATKSVHHGFVESHQALAAATPSGRVTLWDSTKDPFLVRKVVAGILGWPLARLRVIAARVGGDFGGKGSVSIEPVCVLLALRSGYPVKIVLDFREELTATFIRTASHIELTSVATRSGDLVALKARLVFDAGAYSDSKMTGHPYPYNIVQGPYRIPNVDIEARVVYTNNTPTGACRGPRGPQQHFAIESHLDGLAKKVGLSPLDFRLRNVMVCGQKLPAGGILAETGIARTMMAAREHVFRDEGPKRDGEGWGVACAWWSIAPRLGMEGPPSSAWVKFNEDGTATLFTGCTEQGGGQHDVLVQIAAAILSIPPGDIAVLASDTDATPYEIGTGGHVVTRVGNSVKLAAEDARRQLLDAAASRLKAAPEGLELGGGKIFRRGAPGESVTVAGICAEAITSARGPIVGVGADLREEDVAENRGEKGIIDSMQTATHAVKLAVDRETGKIRILKYFASHDVGFTVNERNIEGQIEGGVVQGMGFALSEQVVRQKAITLNPGLRDYRAPRSGDAPRSVETSLVESPRKYGAFGARGVGEPPNLPVAAAIGNAIYDAVGVRIRDLPFTSDKIVAAMRGLRAGTETES